MLLTILSATPFEIAPLVQFLDDKFDKKGDYQYQQNHLEVHILISGIGLTATAYSLGKYFAFQKPKLIINLGIAGAINSSLNLGDVVQVNSECFGDMGAENGDGHFLDLFKLDLINQNDFPYQEGVLQNPDRRKFDFLPTAKGLTVNKVHGQEASIEKMKSQFDADVETMEGAAFFYVCLLEKVPFLQIRAISNYVEERNREAWNIPLAIDNLNKVAVDMVSGFSNLTTDN